MTVSGFFIPANISDTSQASTVIIVHGFNDCKRRPFSLTPAGMLRQNGFNSLVIDLRNHGDSEVTIKRMTGGLLEAQDVLGAWDWLVKTRGIAPEKIGVFGYSLGGATIIHAMAYEPQIVAGWADSTFDSMDSVLQYQLRRNNPSLPTLLSKPALLLGNIAHGIDLTTNTTSDAIQGLAGRPLHLLHSHGDESVPFSSYQTLATVATHAGVDLVTWEVDGSGHIERLVQGRRG